MLEKNHQVYPWFLKQKSIVLIGIAFFIFLSIISFYICFRHYQHDKEHLLKKDYSTAYLISLLLDSHIQKIIKTMESYTDRHLLIQAVKNRDHQKAKRHLIELVKRSDEINTLAITDIKGTAWAIYLFRPEVIGKNFFFRDWYKGVSREWRICLIMPLNLQDLIRMHI